MRKYIIIFAFILMVAGCTRKEEKDWIIGKWEVVSCTYVNDITGKRCDCSPGFKTWEFLERGNVIVDGERSVPYRHVNGHFSVDGTYYDEVVHGRDMMQLQEKGVTYTFNRRD